MPDAARFAAETLRLIPRKRVSRAMGRLSDLRPPRAMLDAFIGAYVRAYDVDLSEAVVPDGGWSSFDEFFTRTLVPGARPVDEDPDTLVSPADGRLEDLGPIDLAASLLVKGRRYDVAELLGDPESAKTYRGGTFFIVYLSPRDYHRVHAPVAGEIVALRHVPGTLYPVNRIGLEHIPGLFARNERVVVRQRTERFGEVATVMVGAIGVGRISVSFDDLRTNVGEVREAFQVYEDGRRLERGGELGTFHLGSTAIVFVQQPMKLLPAAGTSVRVGEGVARREAGA